MELNLKTSDFTGLKCPLPVLKARRVIKLMKKGDNHIFLSDDPASPIDFRYLCEIEKLKLIVKKEKKFYKFLITKI